MIVFSVTAPMTTKALPSRTASGTTKQYGELNQSDITEDLSHSWTGGHPEPRHPFEGSTIPTDMREGYSWCKAPRLNGTPMEVGALARQLIDGHPLVRALVSESGGNVRKPGNCPLAGTGKSRIPDGGLGRTTPARRPFLHHDRLAPGGRGYGTGGGRPRQSRALVAGA